jgi:hypothetical protein
MMGEDNDHPLREEKAFLLTLGGRFRWRNERGGWPVLLQHYWKDVAKKPLEIRSHGTLVLPYAFTFFSATR